MTISTVQTTDENILVTLDKGTLDVNLSDVGSTGRVGLVFRDEYSATTQYYQGDAVRYDNFMYISTTSHLPGNPPSDGANPPTTSVGWGLLLDTNIEVDSHGTMPEGSLQNALNHLEDKHFVQDTAPTGASRQEGDLWYDTINDQLKAYRNEEWEIVTFHDALNEDFDEITMNGGYF